MFSINILGFMSNFNFKGDTVYRLIPSGGIDLFIPPDSRMGDVISRDSGATPPCRAAYRRRLIVVALHTVNGALCSNPFALKMRSAYIETAQFLMISSTWEVTDQSLVIRTQRIFSSETFSIPTDSGSGTVHLPVFATSISLDLSVLSFRLFDSTHFVTPSKSSLIV